MREERPELARRIPGATNAGPASPTQCPLSAAMVERLRAAVDAARASEAVAASDLVLHEASEEPGSLWAAAAKPAPTPSAEPQAPNGHKIGSRRFRLSFPLLRLWR